RLHCLVSRKVHPCQSVKAFLLYNKSKDLIAVAFLIRKLKEFYDPSPRIELLRDSSGHIVTETGKIIFSATNFTDTLYYREVSYGEEFHDFDEALLYTLSRKMEKVEVPVTMPAGEFNDVLDYQGTAIIYQRNGSIFHTKRISSLYANNVGKVFESLFYLSSDWMYERRLVRYHVIQE
ncbi:MAG: hypothetical protein LBI82_00510, partial [Dysgonamonadaceae bacterium]|nr:hypothetical protein [Dysgonamonadaceae bacterium]